MKHVTTLLAFSLLVAGPALAGSATSGTTGTSGALDFKTLDTDRNGFLSSDEFSAGGASDTTMFGRIDRNGDGSVSRTELDSWNTTGSSSGTSGTGTGSSTGTSGTSGTTGGSGTGGGMGSGSGMGGTGSGSGTGGSGSSGSGGSGY